MLMSSKCVMSDMAESVSDKDEVWKEDDDLESVRLGGEDDSRVASAVISSLKIA